MWDLLTPYTTPLQVPRPKMMHQFIYAECTGDIDPNLFCVQKMILIIHTEGHFPYGKSSLHILFNTMYDLPNLMSKDPKDL